MNFASTLLLAFAMSTDAFAAAVGKGAALHRPPLREAVRTGLIFGAIEAVTPVIGWAAGLVAASYVKAWDHWIAFALLGVLGLRMVHAGWTGADADAEAPPSERPRRHGFWVLALTGLGTSIDAMAVGVGLAFVDADILSTALAIGLATTLMVTAGVLVGRVVGRMAGRRAEIAGGLVLIGIGCTILYEHLTQVAG
ncbi:manganese efflux pump MntP [uncultured Xylophilus sp.]|uniref:manganese efflux pump MntP n=1 Tax=uncultured Xylophilus sp. TaxID=296832 RepID=UPI0025F54248|nr:manganese efflux pump MntP [uncultured Xylophilus sp.]